MLRTPNRFLLLVLATFVLLAGHATSQSSPPSLQVTVPTLYFQPGETLDTNATTAPGPCGPQLTPGAQESASASFSWTNTLTNGTYRLGGPVSITIPYTGPSTTGPTGENNEAVSAGFNTTVTLRLGSATIGAATANVDPGRGPAASTLIIEMPSDVAEVTGDIAVDVSFTPQPQESLPAPAPLNNVALACGSASLVESFRIIRGIVGDGDLDGDGIPDSEDSGPNDDLDGDGFSNAVEAQIACVIGTGDDQTTLRFEEEDQLQPGEHDQDGDGFTDEEECAAGSDPTDQLSIPPPPPSFPWGLVIFGLILLALIAALLFFFLFFGKAGEVVIVSSPTLIVPKGEEGKFQVRVRNLAKKGNPTNFQLSASGAPEGWDARLNEDHVVLDPEGGSKNAQDFWLIVESPEHEDPESAVVTVKAIPLNKSGRKDTFKLSAKADTITSINIPPTAKVPVKRGGPVKEMSEKELAKQSTAPVSAAPEAPAAAAATSDEGDDETTLFVEGIGPEYEERLKKAKITTTHQLMAADAAALSKKTDIPEASIRNWQQQADLIRIDGIGKQYAEVLVRAGITSCEQLAQTDSKEVVKKVSAYLKTVKKKPLKGKITAKLVDSWKAEAQTLAATGTAAAPAAASAPAPQAGASEKPKLQVGNLQHKPPAFHKGDSVKSSVTVTNQGSQPHSLKLSLFVNEALADAQTVTVKPGKAKDVQFKWTAQDHNKLNIRGEVVPS